MTELDRGDLSTEGHLSTKVFSNEGEEEEDWSITPDEKNTTTASDKEGLCTEDEGKSHKD